MSTADCLLPEALWLLVIKQLANNPSDLLAVASTCTLLNAVVVQDLSTSLEAAAAAHQRVDCPQRQWRDALLLAAWRHQQQTATGERTSPQQQQQQLSPPLAQLLLEQDGESSVVAAGADHDSCATTTLSASLAAVSLGAQQLFAFSSFWLPSTALLTAMSCLITDGQCATVFLEQQQQQRQQQQQQQQQRQQQQRQQQHPAQAPAAARPLLLLKGHLAPADTSAANTPLSQLLHEPGGARGTVEGSSGVSHNSSNRNSHSSSIDTTNNDSQHGLMHLLACVQHLWSSPGGHHPAQVILMPQQRPPGSIAGLQHPWPPRDGCDEGSIRRLLRKVLIHSLPALLLPGSSCQIDGLGRFLQEAPAPWLASLAALDISRQCEVSDAQLARLIGSCSSLVIARMADSNLASLTLMMLGTPPPAAAAKQPCGGIPGSCLRVLDVSGCAVLASTEGLLQHQFQLFQAAVGRLHSLEELWAARLNADRALACGCESAATATLEPTASVCAFCRTMERLVALDVSDATSLSAAVLAQLLCCCRALKRLDASGCRSMAAGDLYAALLQQQQKQQQQRQQQQRQQQQRQQQQRQQQQRHQQQQQQQRQQQLQQPCVPALTHLAVGWGWSAPAICILLACSPCLVHFTAAVGAGVSDDVLQHLATNCHDLQHLRLSMCAVSSAGVAAVLTACPKLHSLQLQQCVGPMHLPHMLAPATRCSSSNSRWRMSTLQLSGPPCVASDSDLLRLLSGGSSARVSQHLPPPRMPLAHLCLGRMHGLSDALLESLAASAPPLRDLRLEDCCNSTPAGAAPAFSPRAVLQLVLACGLTLQSLQLRHATVAPLPNDFVSGVVRAAPLLKMLCLDACDLASHGGFELVSAGRHAALTTVHVCRCKEVHGVGGHQPSGAVRADKELVVHLLQHGRSVHLPIG